MLSQEENELLTRVGPGTLMGNLLRRYWTPALLCGEVPESGGPPVRVRLFGENLVAFRDTSGQVGLLQENCPHRGASLYFGRNEDCALRCVYHGWAYDRDGNCVDMPSEPRSFADRIKARAYPVHESGGVVWTYMGPRETMTPFRDFGTDLLAADAAMAAKQYSSCNFIQAMEGNLDSAHISFLHQFNAIDDIPDDGSDRPGYPSNAYSMKIWRHDKSPRFEMSEEWYGYRYAAVRTTPKGHKHVRINAFVYPFNTCVANVPYGSSQGIFVPIDDTSCWRYLVTTHEQNRHGLGGPRFFEVPQYPYDKMRGQQLPSGIIPRALTAENDYCIDREAQRTVSFSGIADFVSQDLMVTESMGPVYDRTQEHLGTTDVALIRMRGMLLKAARDLAEGKGPPAVEGDLPYASIRSAEKILEPEEDWRVLGTDADPLVRKELELGAVLVD